MSAELQIGLPNVIVSTLKRPSECIESDETPSKKHHGAEQSSPSNSQPVSTKTHANGGDPKQITLSGRLVEALSQVPYSPLFGILWPIIVEQASFETRDLLRKVNPYFKVLCHPYRRSDRAKSTYVSHFGNPKIVEGLPFVLDLSFDAEWRCWGAVKCGFHSTQAFRAFCALGDIDPDQGRSWDPYAAMNTHHTHCSRLPELRHIWMSRTKDVIFESLGKPLEHEYCLYFGLTGVADKAIVMYNFMHDNHEESDDSEDEPAMTTMWAQMTWGREYI